MRKKLRYIMAGMLITPVLIGWIVLVILKLTGRIDSL
jgi:hypothetical protein